MLNILVLCTGNSVRSIMAEAIFNRDGAGRVRAWSAGSNPTGRVHPAALDLLRHKGLATGGYRSKSWDEFAAPGAPQLDLVITVCASAAGETCPIWRGGPLSVHWGIDDPAAAPPDQAEMAFQTAYHQLSRRIGACLALPIETLSRPALAASLQDIGDRP